MQLPSLDKYFKKGEALNYILPLKAQCPVSSVNFLSNNGAFLLQG